MKKTLLTLLSALLLGGATQAQEFGGGIKVGADFSTFRSETLDANTSFFPTAGIFGFVRPINKIGLRLEANINRVKMTTKDDFFTDYSSYLRDPLNRNVSDFSMLELSIPILAEYRVVRPLLLETGVQFSSILSVNDYNDIITDKKEFFKQSYLSWVIGGQFHLTRKISINARYIHGLSDINNTNVSERWKVGRYQLSLQYHLIRIGI